MTESETMDVNERLGELIGEADSQGYVDDVPVEALREAAAEIRRLRSLVAQYELLCIPSDSEVSRP